MYERRHHSKDIYTICPLVPCLLKEVGGRSRCLDGLPKSLAGRVYEVCITHTITHMEGLASNAVPERPSSSSSHLLPTKEVPRLDR